MHSGSADVSELDLPDPYGEAALLLVESLIHSLTDRLILTHAEALQVAQIAADAQIELSLNRNDSPPEPRAGKLLSLIIRSLAIDCR